MGVADHARWFNPWPPYVLPGASLQFTVTATDAEGDAITFTATGVPSGATFDSTGVFFSGLRPGRWAPINRLASSPADGFAFGASTAVSIVVTNSPPPPPATVTLPVGRR